MKELKRNLEMFAIVLILISMIVFFVKFTIGLFKKETAVKHWIVLLLQIPLYFFVFKPLLRI